MKISLVLTSLAFTPVCAAVLPKEAGPETPWEDLQAVLTAPDILTPGNVVEWQKQCIQIFEDVGAVPGVDGSFAVVSNYLTMNQPSGLCLDHASCAFENCQWPPTSFPDFPTIVSPFVIFDGSNKLREADLESETLLLPAMVLQPKSASDIVEAVNFCTKHDIGINVKVAGHSYFGASTGKNTLLVKMNPNYPKYAIQGSLIECADLGNTTAKTPPANHMACALATARNKNAVLRVGGGELFDEAYRAVSFDWNEANQDRKYHLVGGGAGTVSAAGGWMASGGLSGTTAMRMYGIGIDNVVALEMVLPTGQHVRLAPTSWTDVEEGYPETQQVTGYCNSVPTETNETLWEWGDCDPSIDFNELWFAVRGGGGGSFGIVTSLHYQLHDYPGKLQYLYQNPSIFPEDAAGRVSEEAFYVLSTKHIEFLQRFLYSPETLNVTQAESRACNSAQTANLSPITGGLFFCYGTSGTVMVQKWTDFISATEIQEELLASGIPQDLIDILPGLFEVQSEYDSYAAAVLAGSTDDPAIPEGRLADSPRGSIVPMLGGFPNLGDSLHTHIPLAAVQADPVGMSKLLALDMGIFYAMGGMVPFADDGMNALSPTRRTAAFMMPLRNVEVRDAIFDIAFGSLGSTGDFPGSSCHNHALIFEMGPQKNDWSKSCPTDWEQSVREEKCLSTQTASWGSTNLARLEAFKAIIDPNSLFICAAGVGYSNPVVNDTPLVAPTSGPTSRPTSGSDRKASARTPLPFVLSILFASLVLK